MTFTDVYQDMKARADRVRQMRHARAIKAYCEAFGGKVQPDSQLDMCVIGNSLLDLERGRPWRDVDYSKMRLAKRLANNWREHDLCVEFYTRKIIELRAVRTSVLIHR